MSALKTATSIPMRRHRRRWIALAIGMVAAAVIYSTLSSDDSAIAIASRWARLAPLPSTAASRQVEVKGTSFTREFVISFTAPISDVQQWLNASPGIAEAKRSTEGGETVYLIRPGDGAQFAEVRVNEATGQVRVRTYWS